MFSGYNINDNIESSDLNNIIKNLYETSFFKDVSINFEDNILLITVDENPLIQSVIFEGIKNKSLIKGIKEIILQKEKSSFVESKVKKDQDLILNSLRVNGYYFSEISTKIKNNSNNTVDIIYNVSLGEKALIKNIKFIGNKIFKNNKLRKVIVSEEAKFWKFLSTKKTIDVRRFDLDQDLLNNFYKNNGYYNSGEVIAITVNFIEEVFVTSGTPTLELETGNTDAIANYTSGSGTKTLIFTYTVSESDSSDDLDYTSSNALSLNGGTIKDEAGHNANIILPDPGELNSLGRNRNIVIDNVDPVLSYVTSSQSNGTYNIGDNIYLNVVFNENIYVVGSPKLEISVSNQTVNDSSKTISFYNRSGSIARFRYQVLEGDTTSLLEYTSQSALSLNNGNIIELGKKPKSYSQINGQYIGLLKIKNARYLNCLHSL